MLGKDFRKRLAIRAFDLCRDDIDARDLFRHTVLDLQARVHLEEVEGPTPVVERLDRADIVVAHVRQDLRSGVGEFEHDLAG